jgi:hypothetical protein
MAQVRQSLQSRACLIRQKNPAKRRTFSPPFTNVIVDTVWAHF